MNPIGTFRRLRDIARRRPLLVTAVGLGLLGEAGRVGMALDRGVAVTLFDGFGGVVWDAGTDAVWVGAYVAWVALCGVIVVGLGLAGWRTKRATRGAPQEPQEPQAVVRAEPVRGSVATKPAAAPSGGAVLWRRR